MSEITIAEAIIKDTLDSVSAAVADLLECDTTDALQHVLFIGERHLVALRTKAGTDAGQ
jgi:hypothetical protein